MKKILLFMIWFFLTSCAIFSFAYADSTSDIETIYSDKISSIETQMNRAFSDLEKIYITSISNAQARLKDANDNIKRIQDNYSFQLDLAINAFKSSWVVLSESELQSMAVDSIRWIKTQVDAQIDAQEKIVTQIMTQIKSLQNEKVSKLAQIKSQYQVKIDALIAERTSLIESLVIQPSNPVQTSQPINPVQINSTNNSSQITNNNNSSQTVYESNKIKCPENSYDIYNGNGAYISCKCKQGFEYGSFGACTSKYKWVEESCKLKHWANSSSSNWSNSNTDCICNSWYTFSTNKICITEKEKQIEDNSLARNTQAITQETNINKRNSWSYAIGQGQIQTSVNKTNNQDDTKISPYDKFDYYVEGMMKANEFRKSKLLKVNSKFEVGATIAVYKMDWFWSWTKVWKAIVWRNWQIRYSVKTPWKYKFLLNQIQY